jgi:gluconokinase
MSANIALTDADRWDWLETLRDAAVSALKGNPKLPGCVVTCSALKVKYRDVMRIAAYKNPHIRVHFVYLSASEAVLVSRVSSRQNHYMKPDMVQSQLKDLEAPTPDEQDVISVDVSATVWEVEEEALRKVREAVSSELVRDS